MDMDKEVGDIYLDYISNKSKNFISEKDNFIKTIASREIMVVILKGHLYLENSLQELLCEVIDINAMETEMSFKQKMDLAKSLGLVDDYTYRPLHKFNKIRNAYSHNVNYKFDESEYDDLLSTLSKEDKDQFIKNTLKDDGSKNSDILINTLLLIALIWSKIKVQKAFALKNLGEKIQEKQAYDVGNFIIDQGGDEEAINRIVNYFVKS